MKAIFVLLLCIGLRIVTGIPVPEDTDMLSARTITHLKHDALSGRYYLYRRDGSLHGTYTRRTLGEQLQYLQSRDGGGSCTKLDVKHAQQMPGWKKLEQYAKSTWGEGSWNIVTNPDDFPDSPANACVDQNVVPLSLDGPPSCIKQSSVVQGRMDGTSGKVIVDQSASHSISGSWTVTQTTSMTDGFDFNLGVSVPDTGVSAGFGFSSSTTITNEQSKSFSTSSNSSDGVSLQVDSPNGKDCNVSLNTQTCNQNTKGSLPIVASGWVWFNYDDSRPPVSDPNGGSHFKYAASIEAVLTDKADRSSPIEFQGPINMVTRSAFSAKCS